MTLVLFRNIFNTNINYVYILIYSSHSYELLNADLNAGGGGGGQQGKTKKFCVHSRTPLIHVLPCTVTYSYHPRRSDVIGI